MAEEKEKADKKACLTKGKEPSQFSQLIGQIEQMSVKDLAGLVKELEERWGVSAAVAAAVPIAAAGPGAAEQPAEKAEYTVHLAESGAQKIAVIKAVREIRPDLGLKEAKDLVDGAPKDVKEKAPKAEAEEAKKKLEAAGAKVELK